MYRKRERKKNSERRKATIIDQWLERKIIWKKLKNKEETIKKNKEREAKDYHKKEESLKKLVKNEDRKEKGEIEKSKLIQKI